MLDSCWISAVPIIYDLEIMELIQSSVIPDNLTEIRSRPLLPLSIASLIYLQYTASLLTIVLIITYDMEF